jgi:hypothetical protein
MTRRELLRGGALLLAGSSPAACVRERRTGSTPAPPAGAGDGAPLTEPEQETLLAFCEVLVGDRPFAPAEREELLKEIVDRAGFSADTLRRYRETATLLDARAGGAFGGWPIADRTAIVARNDFAPSRAPLPRTDDAAHNARAYVAPGLIASYYASSMGWAAVGYVVFPGRCSDLGRYTSPEP